jgi:hypothetical protein
VTAPFESLAAFQAMIEVAPREDAERLRAVFVETRLDPERVSQGAEALQLRRFSDGLAYTGYLWDYLDDPHVVREGQIWNQRLDAVAEVYAMWDIHSAERIFIPDYWKFPRETVLRADPATLRRGLQYLPEDLYLFDESFAWAGALTHEWLSERRRYCLWCGTRPGVVGT